MKIALIAAVDKNNLIGCHGKLPWHLPSDLTHFKELTLNHFVIFGRKTYESIPGVLSCRDIVVISKHSNSIIRKKEDIVSYSSVEIAINDLSKDADISTIFIGGGESIYNQTIGIADKIYLTIIDHMFDGDVYFPEIDKDIWGKTKVEKHSKDIRNPYDYSFIEFERKA